MSDSDSGETHSKVTEHLQINGISNGSNDATEITSRGSSSSKDAVASDSSQATNIEGWGKISFSDVSNFFKTSEEDTKESLPGFHEVHIHTNETSETLDSSYSSNNNSSGSDQPSSSSYSQPSTSFNLGGSIESLCNARIDELNAGKEQNSSQSYHKMWYRKCRILRKWQLSKLFGLAVIFAGITTAVLAATIAAALHERHSMHNRAKNSPFGKVYRKQLTIRTEMIDFDTPSKFKSWNSSLDEKWDLVFSDEFNCEGRTFYPGDDQFWEAVDIHYAATDNMEWLDPAHVTTKEGALRITMSNEPSHNLNYTSGMLQSWNKLCFTQGYVETSIRMPGTKNTTGLWPAFWSLGNLARAGYMASTEGTWPYSYDACDIGVTANQSSNDGLSHLPGQKLNSCICPGEDHPNPGTARAAPEIDILEGLNGDYAQTFNVAPFDIWRYPDYDHLAIENNSISAMNSFMGTQYQEAVSAVTKSNPMWYDDGNFVKFGMEYRNDMENRMDNFINFYVNDVLTFRVTEGAFHPDGNINWRLIPREPMSLILNLGISNAWSEVNLDSIQFPVFMDVDYVRIYQPKDKIKLSCDPYDYPTTDYISRHINAYTNANLTTWEMAGYEFPKYSLDQQCAVP